MRAALWLIAAAACSGAATRPPRSEGERLYRAKCTSCHAAWEPSRHTPEEWRGWVDKMIARKKVRLEPAEKAEILTWLTGSP